MQYFLQSKDCVPGTQMQLAAGIDRHGLNAASAQWPFCHAFPECLIAGQLWCAVNAGRSEVIMTLLRQPATRRPRSDKDQPVHPGPPQASRAQTHTTGTNITFIQAGVQPHSPPLSSEATFPSFTESAEPVLQELHRLACQQPQALQLISNLIHFFFFSSQFESCYSVCVEYHGILIMRAVLHVAALTRHKYQ